MHVQVSRPRTNAASAPRGQTAPAHWLQVCTHSADQHTFLPTPTPRSAESNKINKCPQRLHPNYPSYTAPHLFNFVLFSLQSYFLTAPVLSLHMPTPPLGTASGWDPSRVSHLLPLPKAPTPYLFLIIPLKFQNLPMAPPSTSFTILVSQFFSFPFSKCYLPLDSTSLNTLLRDSFGHLLSRKNLSPTFRLVISGRGAFSF